MHLLRIAYAIVQLTITRFLKYCTMFLYINEVVLTIEHIAAIIYNINMS